MASNKINATSQVVIRADRQGIQVRAASKAGGMPTLHGHFSKFGSWAEIDSWSEGHFMERFAPGCYTKTFNERTPKVLFQHGQDPQIGEKPLGIVTSIREDGVGGAYEVDMFDTAYNRELIPGLEAGAYGVSMRFKALRQTVNEKPGPSEWNPDGLPERTIKEAQVMEFGPVTWPAYADATAGVRSLTDRFLFDAIERNPEMMRSLAGTPSVPDGLLLSRMDTEDLSTLAQMIALGASYIDEQDEPEDQVNVAPMENILGQLAALVPYEVKEDEGTEAEDESASADHRTLPASTPSEEGTPEPRRRPSPDTSSTERRAPTTPMWPEMSQEEYDRWIQQI